jgi:hypothetical protein
MKNYIKNCISILENEDYRRKIRYFILSFLIVLFIFVQVTDVNIKAKQEYSDYDHVALYIIEYNTLPNNYVPKSQGVSEEAFDVTVFAVYDNTRIPSKLPLGYTYTEAYINATKENIGKERFVFSDDQLFYTDDHYDTFEEITRFDILGTHYIYTTLLYITILGTSIVIVLSIRFNILLLDTIKKDISNDFSSLKNFSKEKLTSLREHDKK